jgi:ectoine hydroxylase-related dioxygenase (phytanoyl-CoA dioxygenase family)
MRSITELMMSDDPHRVDRHDADGCLTKLSLRNSLGDDAFSAAVQCERSAKTVENLLGSEVYHYHHKVMIKEPLVGGAWEWHQDYGYWYQNGCLRPDMASCMVAITRATRANGCVEVVPGSHLFPFAPPDPFAHEKGRKQATLEPGSSNEHALYHTRFEVRLTRKRQVRRHLGTESATGKSEVHSA